MIAYSIHESRLSSSGTLKLGFSVWARSLPKEYLSVYPKAAQEVQENTSFSALSLCALVDDIWPRIELSRTRKEQKSISDRYITLLPELGFHTVHLVSEFVGEMALEACLSLGTRITLSEFWKLLPQSKKENSGDLTLVEAIGFLWHVHVLEVAVSKYELTGMLAGIKSEFFYLAARKLLPLHDVHFVNTS